MNTTGICYCRFQNLIKANPHVSPIKQQIKMPYNPNIHHRKSIRLKGYDYSQAGLHFITICTQNRACLFGDIKNGDMILNNAGEMVKHWYYELNNKFNDIKCHTMVIMPNHFHCIIENVGADLRVCPDKTDKHNMVQKHDASGKHDASCKYDLGGEHDVLGEHNMVDEHNMVGKHEASGKYVLRGEHDVLGEQKIPDKHNMVQKHEASGKYDLGDEHDVLGEHNMVQKYDVSGKYDASGKYVLGGEHDVLGEHTGEYDVLGEHNMVQKYDASGKHDAAGKYVLGGEHDVLGEHTGSPLRDVVRWFKTMTTNYYIRGVKQNEWIPFDGKLWQHNYWEHIIRTPDEYQNITQYIINNPQHWANDKLK